MDYIALAKIYHRIDPIMGIYGDAHLKQKLTIAAYTPQLHSVLHKTLIEQRNSLPGELGDAFSALRIFFVSQRNDADTKYQQGLNEQKKSDKNILSLFPDKKNEALEAFRRQQSHTIYDDHCYKKGCQDIITELDRLIDSNRYYRPLPYNPPAYPWDIA